MKRVKKHSQGENLNWGEFLRSENVVRFNKLATLSDDSVRNDHTYSVCPEGLELKHWKCCNCDWELLSRSVKSTPEKVELNLSL